MRLIAADALIERLKFKRRLNGNIPDKCAGYDSAIAQANKLPSVDPVHAAAEALDVSPDRLRELAQAEKEGRLVVLPCKVGDTVYHITTCEYFPQVLDGTMYGSDGGPGTATGFYCPCELAENCPFDADDFDCNINKKKFAVFEDEVVSLCINDCEMRVELGYSGYVDVSDFGKTVFLTREAAEAALEERKVRNDA